MSMKLSRSAYEQLIAENLAWLDAQPRTLERDHVRLIVERSTKHEYGPTIPPCWEKVDREVLFKGIRWQGQELSELRRKVYAVEDVLAHARHYDDRDMLRDEIQSALEEGMFRPTPVEAGVGDYCIAVPLFISDEILRKVLTCKVRLDKVYTADPGQGKFFAWTYLEDGPLLTEEDLASDLYEEGRKRLWVAGEGHCTPQSDWILTPYTPKEQP